MNKFNFTLPFSVNRYMTDPNQKKFNAVVVEDGKEYIEIIKTAILLNGTFQLNHFSNGWDAFHYLKSAENIDLLITDVLMPKMDGFEMVKRLKEIDKMPPTMFLTGKTSKEDIQKGLSLGAIDYIIKPLSPMQLLKKINDFSKNVLKAS